MNEELNRKLPFSLIAEQSLLGSILIDPASINEVADLVKADDFYITEHKQIYLAATELFMTNREIDVVTLIDMLVHKGIYNKSGGEDYIRTLSEVVPTALNVKDYAKIVKEKAHSVSSLQFAEKSMKLLFQSRNLHPELSSLQKARFLLSLKAEIQKISDTYVTCLAQCIIIFTSFQPIPTQRTEHQPAFQVLTEFL